MSLVVRAASPGDAAALHGLISDHAALERGRATLTVAELGAVIVAERPPAFLLVAEAAGVVVGYAAVTFDWSLWRARTYGHLDCLFVAPSARNGGVGTMLLDAAAGLASTEGADRLEWQTPAWNQGATRFYRRAGAESADKTRFGIPLHDAGSQRAGTFSPGSAA